MSEYALYVTTNSINPSQQYVGCYRRQPRMDRWYKGGGRKLQNAFKEIGKANFNRTIIATFSNADEAYAAERSLISAIKPAYNTTGGGRCDGPGNVMYGRKHRPESKAKMAAAHRGKIVSAETRAKQSDKRQHLMWITDKVSTNRRIKIWEPIPDGFVRGKSKWKSN